MYDESPLGTIAQHLVELRQSIASASHKDWGKVEALALLRRIGDIAAYLDATDALVVTGSQDDLVTLIGLEIRQSIVTNAQMLVAELIGARLGPDGGRLAVDVQRALIRAGDRCGQGLAAIARAHIDAKGLTH